MTIKLAARVQAVKPSATLAITARAKALRAALDKLEASDG